MIDEILIEDLKNKDRDSFVIIDIRDEESFAYGHIPGAINIPQNQVLERVKNFRKDKEICVCCKVGLISKQIASSLQELGFVAYSLKGGYASFLNYFIWMINR